MNVVGPYSPFQWQVPTVSVKSLSAVQVVIQWKNNNVCSRRLPEQWMITLTCNVEDETKTSEFATTYFYTLDGRTSKQKLPVQLTPRTKYTVTLTALFTPSCSAVPLPSHWMCGESSTTFTTPPAG